MEEAAQNPANYEIDPELAIQAQQDIAKVFEMVELFRQEFLPLSYYEEADEGDGLDKAVKLLQDELRRSRGWQGRNDLRRLLIADGAGWWKCAAGHWTSAGRFCCSKGSAKTVWMKPKLEVPTWQLAAHCGRSCRRSLLPW